MTDLSADVEVDISAESMKTFIKGKTSVPFKTLVKLILQRKVTTLFEHWGQDSIVISSELLTDLASAQQDNQENRQHLILVTFGCGIFAGFFLFAFLQLLLLLGKVQLRVENLLYIIASMVALTLLGWSLMKARQKQKSEHLYDTMEKIANMVPKK